VNVSGVEPWWYQTFVHITTQPVEKVGVLAAAA
jgi:hypothetical protein